MEAAAKTQRRRTPRKPADPSVIRLEIKDSMGNPRWVTADLVDITSEGFGLALRTPLQASSTVIVRGKLGENGTADNLKVGVRWCIEKPDGSFRAGLEFLNNRSTFTPDEEQTSSTTPDSLDCYEVMQLSPNADADTIARVYRILALRYHPDNTDTGHSETFLRLSTAYGILSDPERRASYDVHYGETKRLRWKIFDQAAVSPEAKGRSESATVYSPCSTPKCCTNRNTPR